MGSPASATAVLDDPEIVDVQQKQGDAVAIKRLNLNLSIKAFDELQRLSKETGRSMTELVRVGLGLVKIAHEADTKGQKMAVVNEDGKPLREIVIA